MRDTLDTFHSHVSDASVAVVMDCACSKPCIAMRAARHASRCLNIVSLLSVACHAETVYSFVGMHSKS